MSNSPPGALVRRRREELDITRENLAFKAGVSTSTVARLELSDKLPSVESLARICRTLRLSLDDVVGTGVADEATA